MVELLKEKKITEIQYTSAVLYANKNVKEISYLGVAVTPYTIINLHSIKAATSHYSTTLGDQRAS